MLIGRIKRIWWQITGLILFNFPFVGSLTVPWLTIPVLNCYSCPLAQGACPIGTIQHFLVIGMIPFLAVGVIGIFGLAAGRFYCGHLCPFGFFQDLLKRLSGRRIRIPHTLEYGKYVSLIMFVLILPPIVKEPFFCTLCPAGSLEAGIPIVTDAWLTSKAASASLFSPGATILNMVGWFFWSKIGLLALVIAAAVLIRRPFCRTACPLGAILGLFNRFSFFVRHPGSIGGDSPRYSLKTCPVDISHPDQVDSSSCVKCRECYSRSDS